MSEIYLAEWRWNPLTPSWEPPINIGVVQGVLDLRSIPQMGAQGPASQGRGLFVVSERDDTIGDYMGILPGSLVVASQKRVLESRLGLGEQFVADTALGILKEIYVKFSDATGATAVKPLRGSPRSGFKMNLGGFGLVVNEIFGISHPAWANTLAVWKADYNRNRQAVTDGLIPLDTLRRFTGSSMRKYGVSYEILIPSEWEADGWLPPSTTVTDDFNRANNSDIGGAWDEDIEGTDDWLSINSNELRLTATDEVTRMARYETDLSSDDHRTQAKFINITSGSLRQWVATRKDSTTTMTFYMSGGEGGGSKFQIKKVITGTQTELSDNAENLAEGKIQKLESDDDQHEHFQDGVSKVGPTTDTAITGNLRTGVAAQNNTAANNWDDFEAADLAAADVRSHVIPAYMRVNA